MIPHPRSPQNRTIVEEPRSDPGNPGKLTLAVVEDDREVRTALNRLLRSMGHDVHLFESAEAFDEHPAQVDCLILDVRLPGASGIELSDRLRDKGSRLPVVFITGDAERVSAPAITKPFSDVALMDAVARAMSAREP
jgi:FixJ family two-component response regulator